MVIENIEIITHQMTYFENWSYVLDTNRALDCKGVKCIR